MNECNVLDETLKALTDDTPSPTKNCAYTCLAVVIATFMVSTATGNYSQVDKLWSIVPFVYCWLVVCDERTLLMAIVATIWGIRLTWNFNRRGGYKWPPWDGDEDYRWKIIQDGKFLKVLKNKVAVSLKSSKSFSSFLLSSFMKLTLVFVSGYCSTLALFHFIRTFCSCSLRLHLSCRILLLLPVEKSQR